MSPVEGLIVFMLVGSVIGATTGGWVWWINKNHPELLGGANQTKNLVVELDDLSGEILNFIGDSRSMDPLLSDVFSAPTSSENFHKNTQRHIQYSQRMRSELLRRYGSRVEYAIQQLEKRGLVNNNLSGWETNYLSAENAAKKIGAAARQIAIEHDIETN